MRLMKVWKVWERRRGAFTLNYLGKVDQTPFPFVMDDNTTYIKTCADEVWIASDQSGLKKRQRTVRLTIFADGNALPSYLIFCGKGLRINPIEKKQGIEEWRSPFHQKHGVMKRSWRSGLKRIGINFFTNHQLLDPPAKFFMQTYIEPSKHPM